MTARKQRRHIRPWILALAGFIDWLFYEAIPYTLLAYMILRTFLFIAGFDF